jgi:hypothetical protein
MTVLSERIAADGITITATRRDRPPHWAEQRDGSTWWNITLRMPHAPLFCTPFGRGNNSEPPTAADVLECVLNDVAAYENADSAEEWAREYSMELDAHAKGIYQRVENQRVKLQAFLGGHYNEYLWGTS